MNQSLHIVNAIRVQGILPLYFHPNVDISLEVLRSLYQAGIRAVEYTDRGAAAFLNFKALIAARNIDMPNMHLGVGTIKKLDQAKAYLESGADFLVSPGFVPDVAAHCLANDIFYAPGCMTPSEILTAEQAGIGFIKLFPGNALGPAFLSSLRDVFPGLMFMPTGGVDPTEQSIASWFSAGVCAVGMGSKLITKQLMDLHQFNELEKNTRVLLEIIARVRA